MEHKIRMIGFDLDGTLLTTEKELTGYTRDVLIRAQKAGVVILPVTGRPLSGIPEEISGFEQIRHLIVSNGARILEDGETICERLLSIEKARKILDIFEEYDTLRDVYYDGQGYSQEEQLRQVERYVSMPAMAQYIVTTRIAVPDIRAKIDEENRDMDKMQAIFTNVKDKEEALLRINELGGVEATGALSNNIEVNGEGVDKGIALLWLAERLGIRREEVMAFGDGANDLRMIQAAGIGVAMSNAIPQLREAADLIAPPNDEEGVARTIEKYVLGAAGA